MSRLFPERGHAAALIALAAALAVVGCGGGNDKEARELSEQSIAKKAPPLDEVLVTRSEINKHPVGSVRRVFLSFWATLQFQAWDEAQNYFADGLRELIGTPLLAAGLEAQAAAFRTSKPKIRAVTNSRGRAVIHFIANDAEGKPSPLSITWARAPSGVWRVVYFPVLNSAFAFAAQQRRQMEVAPLEPNPRPEAVRAGHEARQLQNKYLARQNADQITP